MTKTIKVNADELREAIKEAILESVEVEDVQSGCDSEVWVDEDGTVCGEDGYTVLTIEKWWIGDAYPSQNIVEEHTDDEPYESYTEAELWEDLKNCDEIQVDVDKYMEEILDKKIDGGDYTWIKIEIA